MNKDNVKKLDEMTAEEVSVEKREATDVLASDDLEKINGGLSRGLYNYSRWKEREEAKKKANGEGGAIPNERGASGGW